MQRPEKRPGRATRSHFTRSLSTLAQFDDGLARGGSERGSEDVLVGAGGERTVAVPTAHNEMLLIALLDHLCHIYVIDPLKRHQLFKELSGKLVQQGVMSDFSQQREVSALRAQYRHSFWNVVQAAMEAVAQQNIPVARGRPLQERALAFLQPPLLCGVGGEHSLADITMVSPSRYREEFEELDVLGKGAYGKVYRVQHHLDGQSYAVKKIPLVPSSFTVWSKILREAKHLSGMSHRNVVRYHCAWLEHTNSPGAASSESEPSDSSSPTAPNLPCLTEQESVAVSQESSSIIFQSSSHGHPPCGNIESHGTSCHVSTSAHQETSTSRSRFLRQHSTPTPDSPGRGSSKEFTSMNGALVPALPSRMERSPKPLTGIVMYIQMELCSETLKDWLSVRNLGPKVGKDVYGLVNEKVSLMMLKQILSGLSYIHQQNIIHRDIKPKNIFLTWLGEEKVQVKLGDFGLARDVSADDVPLTPAPGREAGSDEEAMFTSGVGTTLYAAPEQLQGCSYGNKADMYSLGVILFEFYHPFATEMERIHTLQKLSKGIIPIEFQHRWPKQASCVEQLTAGDPTQRPSTQDLMQSEIFVSKDKIIAKLRKSLSEKDRTIAKLQAQLQECQEAKVQWHARGCSHCERTAASFSGTGTQSVSHSVSTYGMSSRICSQSQTLNNVKNGGDSSQIICEEFSEQCNISWSQESHEAQTVHDSRQMNHAVQSEVTDSQSRTLCGAKDVQDPSQDIGAELIAACDTTDSQESKRKYEQ